MPGGCRERWGYIPPVDITAPVPHAPASKPDQEHMNPNPVTPFLDMCAATNAVTIGDGGPETCAALTAAIDAYTLHVKDQHESGTLHITNPHVRETGDFLHDAAAEYGIPFAKVYDEFMGPDGTDNPQDRGLVMPDQRHPTPAGVQLIAEMLHDLGYDPAG